MIKTLLRIILLGFEEFRTHLEPIHSSLGRGKDRSISAEQIKGSCPGICLHQTCFDLAGNGLNMHPNVVQTTRAFAALMALTGNIGYSWRQCILPQSSPGSLPFC